MPIINKGKIKKAQIKSIKTKRIFCAICFFVVCSLFAVKKANAAAITSAQSGNWSEVSTWAGGSVPGDGDTANLSSSHIVTIPAETNITVGTSGITGTVAITLTGTSQLVISGTLNSRGNLVQQRGTTVTGNSDGFLVLDAPTGARYKWTINNTGSGNSYATIAGTEGHVFTVNGDGGRSESGSASYGMIDFSDSAGLYIFTNFQYAKMTNLGDASNKAYNHYCFVNSTIDTQKHVLWHNVGPVYATVATNTGIDWDGVDFRLPLSATTISSINGSVDKTLIRSIKNITVYNLSNRKEFQVNIKQPVIENLIFYNTQLTLAGYSYQASVDNAFLITNIGIDSGKIAPLENSGLTVSDSIILMHCLNQHYIQETGNSSDTELNVYQNNIFDGDDYYESDQGDVILMMGEVAIKNNIMINKAGTGITPQSANARVTFDNNTMYHSYGLSLGEFTGWAATMVSMRNNLTVNQMEGVHQHSAFVSQTGWTLDYNNSYGLIAQENSYANYDADIFPVIVHPTGSFASYMGNEKYNSWFSSGSYGDAGKGANDTNYDPEFIDSSRTVRSYGSWSTVEEMTREMITINGWAYDGSAIAATAKNVDGALAYVREGFSPTNPSLQAAGYDGSDIGAVSVTILNTAPSATFDNDFSSWNFGDITVNYNIIDDDADTCNISQAATSGIEYSTDNSIWHDATDAGGSSEGLTGLAGSASPGTNHIFIWDSATDLAGTQDSTVYLRIRPNDGTADAASWTTSSAFGVDNVLPEIINISSSKTNGSYKVGEIIDIDVTFSENITSTEVTVTLETGAIDRTCTFAVSNASTGTCDYTVQSGDTTSDLNAVISGTIADQAGNLMSNYTPTATLAASKDLLIDTAAPSGGSIVYTNGYYTTAAVALTANDGTESGSGINAETRIIQRKSAALLAGVCGEYGSFSTITPSGSYFSYIDATVFSGYCYQYQYIVADLAGNYATSTSSNTAKIDTGSPSVNASSDQIKKTIFTYDATIYDTISGISSYQWSKQSGAGIITFGTAAGEDTTIYADTDGTYVIRLTATDNAGNSAYDEFTLVWDATTPTITFITSSRTNGSYKVGEIIDIDVTFSESITSTEVTVTLETGAIDRTCTFAVSNASTGTCDYTVQSGDTTSDLNAVISGTIADQAGNIMSNFIPSSTLATNKALIIDTAIPVISAGSPSGQQAVGTSELNITLTTDEAAICKYSIVSDTAYSSMASAFITTGSTSHITSVGGLINGGSYNYYVRCQDAAENENISDYIISFSIAPSGAVITPVKNITKTAPADVKVENNNPQESNQRQINETKKTAIIEKAEQVIDKIAEIIKEAAVIAGAKVSAIISQIGGERNLTKERKTINNYVNEIEKDNKEIKEKTRYAMINFITYGTETTENLGEGERAGVIKSFKSAFNKLPQEEKEWADVIKIANGRWPSARNEEAEDKAKEEFKKIYKREAYMNKANDNAAVTIMAYGLRSAARKMEDEKAGIRIFKGIYGYNPTSASDWDIAKAIAYSGARR